MGLLSFTDEQGVRWRVWRVDTPAARAHLMEASYRNGWLVFEREDGLERRRLSQVPEDWASLSPERLLLLCQVATPVTTPRSSPTSEQAVMNPPPALDRDR